MKRIGRAFRIMKQSWGLLMQDKELLVLPLLSGLAMIAVLASFIFGFGLHQEGRLEGMGDVQLLALTFGFYVVAYAVGFFFQAALVAGACERMSGGDPTLGSALGAASRRLGPILMFAVVAATVGMVLRAIQERSEAVGKIVAGLLGAGWSLLTFFMVPVLVMEGQGVGGSMKRSVAIFKKTWGETLTGSLGFGLLGFLLSLPVVLVGIGLAKINPILGGAVAILLACAISILMSALQSVFVAALYRYATEGEVPHGYSADELEGVFA